MNQLVYLLMLHGICFAAATSVAVALWGTLQWWETKGMNVRSRVQRRFVKREQSLSQTMASLAILTPEKTVRPKSVTKRSENTSLLKTATR
jgi:hypothetical protein